MDRKKFLRSVLGASAFLALPASHLANNKSSVNDIIKSMEKPTSGSLVGLKHAPIEKVRIGKQINALNIVI